VRRLIFVAGLIVFLAGAGAPVAPTAAASASGDTDPPQITLRTPGDGAYYRPDTHVVIVDFQCSDSGSGIASCVGTQPNGASLDTAQAGAHTFTVTAVDGAGNQSSRTITYWIVGVSSVTLASPVDEANYTVGQPVYASYSCASTVPEISDLRCYGTNDDRLVATGSLIDTDTVGPHFFTVIGYELLGMDGYMAHRYWVRYPFSGFDSPVSASGTIEGAKTKEAIPLKFSLGGNRGNSPVVSVHWEHVSCSDWASLNQGWNLVSGTLSYNASADRYTELVPPDPSFKGTCQQLTLGLADSTLHVVNVKFSG
jgi:hypothetical protein